MKSTFNTSLPTRSSKPIAPLLVALFLAAAAAVFILLPCPARAVTPAGVHYSDLLGYAMHDPAFADTNYKTRRDVLTGVVGPETWVEHFVSGGDVIETLTYNSLIYGIVVKKKDGTSEYWAINDDRKTYTASGGQTPSGWSIKNPPSYKEIIDKVKTLVNARRYDDATTYITEVMRENGVETAELYFYLGFAYDQLDEFSYAKLQYRRAISLDPAIADAYYNLGIIYRNQGNPAEAVVLFERYLALNPSDPSAADIRSYINANK
ncbi:MAG: tetratricopeptide repeat protein [Deltaproteobacteria bacterium]|nr:tetratricopeptide repeat protein [Candidatus Zymogenaceae bacterium]